MICIVDYGVGNITAFLNLFKRIGIEAKCAKTPFEMEGAGRLLLPGVGHFDTAMERLNTSGLRPILERMVLVDKVPVMGVCVGMQMLADSSEEGSLPGLGWVPGKVRSFVSNQKSAQLPMPHMGWNQLKIVRDSKILANENRNETDFYFLHSYYYELVNEADIIATSEYGLEFPAVIGRDKIYGVQCHPEKSHSCGQSLLKRFATA
jgi:glutamine amidotransferase